MSNISKSICENTCRRSAFEALGITENPEFKVISNRAYGFLTTDDNGVERMVELRAIVRKVAEDGTPASEIFKKEVADYAADVEEKRQKKAEVAMKKAEKIAKDKAKREAVKKEKEEE